jgi:signal transduction histidine kinase
MISRLAKAGLLAVPATAVLWWADRFRAWSGGPGSDFMPHGYCYLWNPGMVWLQVISDGLMALSYYCISVALVYMSRRRRDLPFNWIFWMFALFILGCGTTHVMEVWTVWHASYLAAGMIKAGTAAVSVLTAVMFVPLISKAIALPSAEQLRAMNGRLQAEVAERERVERELRKTLAERDRSAVQLEAANLELEAFTYSVSHDLRAPLRHIGGFSRILAEDFGEAMAPEARKFLGRIEDGVQHMGQLVNALLNLAHVGRYELHLQATRLNEVVEDVVSMLQPEIRDRKVAWRIASLPTAECDPLLIRQVFQNLIANGLKFSRDRECSMIDIDCRSEGDRVVIVVRDNGVGFDMKYADKLFGVFQRLHKAEEFEGTGIGLATVQRILLKHGGLTWAEGEVGKGASFFFSLAAAGVSAAPTEEARENTAAGASL